MHPTVLHLSFINTLHRDLRHVCLLNGFIKLRSIHYPFLRWCLDTRECSVSIYCLCGSSSSSVLILASRSSPDAPGFFELAFLIHQVQSHLSVATWLCTACFFFICGDYSCLAASVTCGFPPLLPPKSGPHTEHLHGAHSAA